MLPIVCVRGETPGAGVIAARLRAGLEAAGVVVKSMSAA
jgi:hypothetical protein